MAKLQRIGNLSRHGSLATRQRENDEEAVMWASLERLPTYARMTTGILTLIEGEQREVDVKWLGFVEKKALLDLKEDRLIRDRIVRVGIGLPWVEVRFENLKVDAKIYMGY